ncbi:hypothetical protein L243_40685 [Salmonella enterica subsp. enterica serovar Worthington str. BCH-3008]|nr:hypothetical protein L243_40685 [Salmonella enterica subsp. enterica serovar Worthington str. BCH-3008]
MATRNVLSGIALYCRPRAFRTVGFLQGFNFLTTHTEKKALKKADRAEGAGPTV